MITLTKISAVLSILLINAGELNNNTHCPSEIGIDLKKLKGTVSSEHLGWMATLKASDLNFATIESLVQSIHPPLPIKSSHLPILDWRLDIEPDEQLTLRIMSQDQIVYPKNNPAICWGIAMICKSGVDLLVYDCSRKQDCIPEYAHGLLKLSKVTSKLIHHHSLLCAFVTCQIIRQLDLIHNRKQIDLPITMLAEKIYFLPSRPDIAVVRINFNKLDLQQLTLIINYIDLGLGYFYTPGFYTPSIILSWSCANGLFELQIQTQNQIIPQIISLKNYPSACLEILKESIGRIMSLMFNQPDQETKNAVSLLHVRCVVAYTLLRSVMPTFPKS